MVDLDGARAVARAPVTTYGYQARLEARAHSRRILSDFAQRVAGTSGWNDWGALHRSLKCCSRNLVLEEAQAVAWAATGARRAAELAAPAAGAAGVKLTLVLTNNSAITISGVDPGWCVAALAARAEEHGAGVAHGAGAAERMHFHTWRGAPLAFTDTLAAAGGVSRAELEPNTRMLALTLRPRQRW